MAIVDVKTNNIEPYSEAYPYEVTVTPEYWQTWLSKHLPIQVRRNFFGKDPEEGYEGFWDRSILSSHNPKIKEVWFSADPQMEDMEWAVRNVYVNEASKRLYNIFKEAGFPTVHYDENTFISKLYKLTNGSFGTRSYYNSIPNSMWISSKDVPSEAVLSELAHPIQLKYGSAKRDLNWLGKQFARRFSEDIDRKIYNDPTHIEGETHYKTPDGSPGFEKQLYDYIYTGAVPHWLKLEDEE